MSLHIWCEQRTSIMCVPFHASSNCSGRWILCHKHCRQMTSPLCGSFHVPLNCSSALCNQSCRLMISFLCGFLDVSSNCSSGYRFRQISCCSLLLSCVYLLMSLQTVLVCGKDRHRKEVICLQKTWQNIQTKTVWGEAQLLHLPWLCHFTFFHCKKTKFSLQVRLLP